MIRAALIAIALWPLLAAGQDAQPLRGELTAGSSLRDGEFNVEVRAPGLRRQVEVWGADADNPGQGDWLDPAQQPGTAAVLPIVAQTWLAEDAAIDAQPVAADLLALVSGWQPLRIELAQLPENLAAVFVAVDGILYSGNDPAAPEPGDLRVRWSVLPAGSAFGVAYWRDGAWHAGTDANLQYGLPKIDDLPGLARSARPGADLLWWLALMLPLPVMAIFIFLRRRR